MICHECNSQMDESQEIYHYKESGLDNVYLDNVCVYRCKCGEVFPSIPGVIKLHTTIGQMIVKKSTALNGKEIIFLRKNIGMNAKTFADYVGIDKSTLSRWENNQQKLAKPNDRLVRLIYAHQKGLSKNDIDNLLKDSIKDLKESVVESINIPVSTKSFEKVRLNP
jgi:putative zinc finger/helix-turn-helix YgiT family protein